MGEDFRRTMFLPKTQRITRSVLALCLTWMLLPLHGDAAESADAKRFSAQLVWCTDSEKPAGKELKDLAPKLRGKISRIFKWKNYFEVSRRPLSLPADDGKRIRISDRCEVIMSAVDAEKMEVVLYGDKKLAGKNVMNFAPILEKGELLVIGGDDRDNYGDAWLLIISAAPQKR